MLLTNKIKCLQEMPDFHWETDTVLFPGSSWNINIWISVWYHLTVLEQYMFKSISELVQSLEWEEKGKAACLGFFFEKSWALKATESFGMLEDKPAEKH